MPCSSHLFSQVLFLCNFGILINQRYGTVFFMVYISVTNGNILSHIMLNIQVHIQSSSTPIITFSSIIIHSKISFLLLKNLLLDLQLSLEKWSSTDLLLLWWGWGWGWGGGMAHSNLGILNLFMLGICLPFSLTFLKTKREVQKKKIITFIGIFN